VQYPNGFGTGKGRSVLYHILRAPDLVCAPALLRSVDSSDGVVFLARYACFSVWRHAVRSSVFKDGPSSVKILIQRTTQQHSSDKNAIFLLFEITKRIIAVWPRASVACIRLDHNAPRTGGSAKAAIDVLNKAALTIGICILLIWCRVRRVFTL